MRELSEDSEAVGAVARSLGVSVRTLHHWDALKVASPSSRTHGGYRAYSPADVARLRRVLLLREVGVPLVDVPGLLSADAVARRAELEGRRAALAEKIRRLQAVAVDLDRLLEADEVGMLLSAAEQREVFGDAWNPSWPTAARQQWGDSAQWAEYAERSSGRTKTDWQGISRSADDVTDALAEAKRAGVTPGSPAANALAERHRAATSDYFHCTLSMQVLLAQGYLTAPGYREYYNQREPGLTVWLKDVIEANARAHGVDPDTAVWE